MLLGRQACPGLASRFAAALRSRTASPQCVCVTGRRAALVSVAQPAVSKQDPCVSLCQCVSLCMLLGTGRGTCWVLSSTPSGVVLTDSLVHRSTRHQRAPNVGLCCLSGSTHELCRVVRDATPVTVNVRCGSQQAGLAVLSLRRGAMAM